MERMAQRVFSISDQERFAVASGDRNPMHVDALQARRTQAGAPVVHGIHLLLWAIEQFAATEPDLQPLRSVRAQFNDFVYLGEPAELRLAQRQKSRIRLAIGVGIGTRVKITLETGASDDSPAELSGVQNEIAQTSSAIIMDFDSVANCAGRFRFPMNADIAANLFPHASKWIGPNRIAGIAATTYLVGMVCPGLNSIFGELSLKMCPEPGAPDSLAFRVSETDPRFRMIEQEVAGGGVTGIVKCFVRNPPVQQAGMETLRQLVGPAEFADSIVLVIGGSRGLGELTAKLIAAGGGRVVISFNKGEADAQRVAAEIRASGGACEVLHYDAGLAAADQIASLTEAPTHVYYFATPAIFRPALDVFDQKRFEEFTDIYVKGFWDLVKATCDRRETVSFFYPSSVAVTERPAGMTEYSMAKAAGEVLCADINQSMSTAHVTVSRLPRLPTDQTATITQVDEADPVATMLPIVREVQSLPK